MAERPLVAFVGAGNVATALAVALRRAGYEIESVVSRSRGGTPSRAQSLAREVGARHKLGVPANTRANVIWFCVPDSEIAHVARSFAQKLNWNEKIALHSSGALTSAELLPLREHGAAVASVHPLMTFVRRSRPSLAGVPFAIEGDAPAVKVARNFVRDLGGRAYPVQKQHKAAYHAWGTFASPLFTALLSTTEQVASAAGVRPLEARRRMIPILLQTLANYASFGPADAFSGPIVRGDADTVKRHLQVLADIPAARDVYLALARAALQYLPARNNKRLQQALKSARK